MAELDQLIKQARKAALEYGGLLSLLLAVKGGAAVTWDANRAQFRINGALVPITKLRAELIRIESSVAAKVLLYTNNLYSKKWSIEKWHEEMTKLLESNHVIFGALALGGIAAAASSAETKRRIVRDVRYLDGFVLVIKDSATGIVDVKKGSAPLTPAALRRRALSYIRSLLVTYHLLTHRAHINAGFTQAKNILTPAEHCHRTLVHGHLTDGCFEISQRGWMPIQEMPPIGTRVCAQFDKCYLIFKR